MLAGGLRALLVQALEPRAMAGVDQHSRYREDPWGRLRRTTEFVGLTTYGDTPTAEAACVKVRAVHERIRGVDPVTGRAYSASDPDLLLWIHAVEVDSFVSVYRAFAGRLSDEDADRYVAEMVQVAELVELPPGMAPRTMAELREYLDSVEGLQATDAARARNAHDLLPADAAAVPAAVGNRVGGDRRDPAAVGVSDVPAAVAATRDDSGAALRVRARRAR